MSSRITATRGVLLRLKEELSFVERSKELLELKRDNLAREINKLLGKVTIRKEIEKKIMDGYEQLKRAYTSMGYWEVKTKAMSVKPLKVKALTKSIMGISIPTLKIEEQADISPLTDPRIRMVAKKFSDMMSEILSLAVTEAQIEKIAHELMMTNRKVNILEKAVIPNYKKTIKYIEDKLEEESLEEFVRAKKIKQVITREMR